MIAIISPYQHVAQNDVPKHKCQRKGGARLLGLWRAIFSTARSTNKYLLRMTHELNTKPRDAQLLQLLFPFSTTITILRKTLYNHHSIQSLSSTSLWCPLTAFHLSSKFTILSRFRHFLATISNLRRSSMPFRPTLHRNYFSEPNCHVCSSMSKRKYHVQKGDAALCLLCDRPYCEAHKGEEEDVCEVNHFTYYRKHPAFHGRIFSSLAARRLEAGKLEELCVRETMRGEIGGVKREKGQRGADGRQQH